MTRTNQENKIGPDKWSSKVRAHQTLRFISELSNEKQVNMELLLLLLCGTSLIWGRKVYLANGVCPTKVESSSREIDRFQAQKANTENG